MSTCPNPQSDATIRHIFRQKANRTPCSGTAWALLAFRSTIGSAGRISRGRTDIQLSGAMAAGHAGSSPLSGPSTSGTWPQSPLQPGAPKAQGRSLRMWGLVGLVVLANVILLGTLGFGLRRSGGVAHIFGRRPGAPRGSSLGQLVDKVVDGSSAAGADLVRRAVLGGGQAAGAAGAAAQRPTAPAREGSNPGTAGSGVLGSPGRLAAMPTAPGEAEAAAALAAEHAAANSYTGNYSGGSYWPPSYVSLPPDDDDPLAVQTFWARNAAAGLEYVLEHRSSLTPAPDGITECSTLLRVPKVALMFLTRGTLPQAPMWEVWLRAAAGRVPLSAVQAGSCGAPWLARAAAACGAGAGGAAGGPLAQQRLFSAYVHVGSNEQGFTGFPAGHVFHGRDIAERVEVKWGTFSLVNATKALMRAALADPLNQKFVLMSESGIPLYPPTAMWSALMSERLSRINVCNGFRARGVGAWNMDQSRHRWTPKMETSFFKLDHWRKSSQWIAINREHAQIAALDKALEAVFVKLCYVTYEDGYFRDCYSDEHYFATLLATHGRDNETDCLGGITYAHWEKWGDSHPKAWAANEVTANLIRQMRKTQPTCLAPPAISTAAEQFAPADGLTPATCGRRPVDYAHTLGYECTLLGRKFPADTAPAVAALYADCRSQLHMSDVECAAEALRLLRLF
ncbi:hypothetical protein WJX81_001372 [Elliptochloris bilobata]|uniref:Uncharacterized protein n=1 Tax=Elliptochloris bilobata TaxID=381761 RepID=A0AAW1RV32_9CHLO